MINTTLVGYGEATGHLVKTYMDYLDRYLSTYYPAIAWRLHEVSVKKNTLDGLDSLLEAKVLVHHPNIIFIRLSSQDVDIERHDFVGKEGLELRLSHLLSQITSHNNRTGLNNCQPIPIVIMPPPIREKPGQTNRTNNRLAQYIYALKQVVKIHKGIVIDLYKEISNKKHVEQYILEEGYGLTQEGENLLYDLIFVELTKLIDYQGVIKQR